MRELSLTAALRGARNAGSIARADQGADAATRASIRIYSAAPGSGGTLLAQRTLALPCAQINAQGRIRLLDGGFDELVQVSGPAAWAAWHGADGTPLYEGEVTDEAGQQSDANGNLLDSGDTGPWVLAGTHGTRLYAGGVLLLAEALIG